MQGMYALVVYLAGIITALWVEAQNQALNFPVFHLPGNGRIGVLLVLLLLVAFMGFRLAVKRTSKPVAAAPRASRGKHHAK
jgi:hypothetical protein